MISAGPLPSTTSIGSWSLFSRLSVLLYLITLVTANTPVNDWRSKSIYQVITDRFARTDGSTTAPCVLAEQKYCGGTWQGLINKLDYIAGMGFTAIWISPIVKNIEGNADVGQPYHGFWSQDITALNSHFGTADDLKALSKAVHDRGMLLMIDVVANNFASIGPGASTNFANFVPFNDKKYFHPFCFIQDYNDETDYQQCWLGNNDVSLPDMDTENDFVKTTWDNWAKDVVAKYGVDGMRIDAAKHVAKPFWNQFQPAANVYTMGEVLTDKADVACNYMVDGLSAVLNYPMWYAINNTFTTTPALNLSIAEYQYKVLASTCQDTTLLGTFTENQDQPRLGYYTQDTALLKNALAFTLLTDGIPVIYYGAEHQFKGLKDPDNREALWTTGYKTDSPLYLALAAMNAARNAVAKNVNYSYWSPYWTWKSKWIMEPGDVIAVRKGYDHSIVAVMTNKGSNAADIGPLTVTDTNFLEGDFVMDVLSCETQTAGIYGNIKTTVKKGEPQAWIKASLMADSTICPKVDKNTKSSTPKSSAPPTSSPSSSPATIFLALVAVAYSISTLL